MTILVRVVNQKLKTTSNLKSLVSGSQEFVQFKFSFDSGWDGLTVFAQFIQDGTAYNQYLDNNNCVYLPSEIVAGSFDLLLYGTGNSVIATTNYLTYTVDENALVSDAQSTEITLSLYQQLVNSFKSMVGTPLVASTASAMTNTSKIYIYVGSESGYTYGDWYYYNTTNSAWADGGIYNSSAVATDTSLSVSGMAADAKTTGDEISALKENYATLSIDNTIEIPENSDIDDYLTCGNYRIASAAIAETLTNLPTDFTNAGRLLVMDAQGSNRFLQILINADFNKNRIWFRYHNGTRWDDWSDVVTDYKSIPSLSIDKAEIIPKNSDLDDYKTYGSYRITSNTIASTITNIPEDFTNAGRLFVMVSQSTNRIIQLIIDATSVPRMWMRYWNGSSWAAWQKFAYADEIKTSTGELQNCGWVVDSIANGYPRESTHNLSSKRILSDYILVGQNTSITITDADYNFEVVKYDLDKKYIGNIPTSWGTSTTTVTLDEDCYIRITVRKSTDAVIDDTEISEIVDKLSMVYFSPTQTNIAQTLKGVPSYYDEQISSAVAAIRANMNTCGQDGDTFIFITDLHWDPYVLYANRNARRSPALVKKIVEETGIKKIVFGGDYFTGNDDADFEFAQLRDLFNSFDIKNTQAFPMMGNHDWNGYNTSSGEWDNPSAYAQIMKQCEGYVQMGDDLCYYYDVPACKTRYIILNSYDSNSTIPAAQISWFESVLSNTPSGYRIVVGMHVWLKIDGTQDISNQANQIIPICDTFNSDNDNRKVVFMFGGHVHYDYSYTTPGGIPVVLTDTDAYRAVDSGTTATIDTITEQCFDVITLDYVNEKAKCVRIGRGENREFDLTM